MPKLTKTVTTGFLVGGLALTALGCSSDDDSTDDTDTTTEVTIADDSTDTSADE